MPVPGVVFPHPIEPRRTPHEDSVDESPMPVDLRSLGEARAKTAAPEVRRVLPRRTGMSPAFTPRDHGPFGGMARIEAG